MEGVPVLIAAALVAVLIVSVVAWVRRRGGRS